MPAQNRETETAGPMQKYIEFEGRLIPLDEDGHLLNAGDWSEGLAVHLAVADGMELTDEHWQVLHFIREYYLRFKSFPMPRVLIKGLNRELGKDHFTIKSLYALYPDTPMRRSCRYAGIPQPAGCT
jgi:TusE/DsrC/DsvC family sulfur relay protein